MEKRGELQYLEYLHNRLDVLRAVSTVTCSRRISEACARTPPQTVSNQQQLEVRTAAEDKLLIECTVKHIPLVFVLVFHM